mgnify:CR=1 FL=1
MAQVQDKNRLYAFLRPYVDWMFRRSYRRIQYVGKENIPTEHLLVVVDDLALPLGKMRLKAKGSNGGHNGLGHIQQLIGQCYARLRIGIGADFQRGQQIDWVLGKLSTEDMAILNPLIGTACEIIKSFCLAGVDITMNQFNKK